MKAAEAGARLWAPPRPDARWVIPAAATANDSAASSFFASSASRNVPTSRTTATRGGAFSASAAFNFRRQFVQGFGQNRPRARVNDVVRVQRSRGQYFRPFITRHAGQFGDCLSTARKGRCPYFPPALAQRNHGLAQSRGIEILWRSTRLNLGRKYRSHRLTHSAWRATQAWASGAATSRPWFSMKRTAGRRHGRADKLQLPT